MEKKEVIFFEMSENWKHIGILLSGIAALLTASVPIFNFLKSSQEGRIQKIKEIQNIPKTLATVSDPDGWVHVRGLPNSQSLILMKLQNGFEVEILKREGNWFLVKIPSNSREGYIYWDRLIIK